MLPLGRPMKPEALAMLREFHSVSAGHPGPLLIPEKDEARVLPMAPPALGLLPDPGGLRH